MRRVKLDQQVHVESQVPPVLQALQAHLDLEENQVHLAHQANKALKVPLVNQDPQDHLDNRDPQDPKVHVVSLDRGESLGHEVNLVQQDLQEHLDEMVSQKDFPDIELHP